MGEMADLDAQVSPFADVEDAYRTLSSDLVRFATVLVGADAAADVVSSAVVRLLDAGDGSVRNYRAYMFQVVVNEARNWKRSETRRRLREERSSVGPEAVYPDEPYPELRRAVEDLSMRQRAVVYLSYWEDLTDDKIGGYLGISAGSVRRHLGRARSKLRGVLGENR